MNSPEAKADVGYGGIKAFAFCDNVVETIESLWSMVKAFYEPSFLGSHVPPYLEKEFIEFMKDAAGVEYEVRETQKVDIDPNTVQSGDFLATMRTDGLGAIIMYGTGARVDHNTMALRFDGELYVVQSTDPVIKRVPWAKFIAEQERIDCQVTYHKLSDEARAKFDEKKAQDFFFETEGLPYGYYNFLYGWVDTPNDNWPPLVPREFVPILFKLVEDIDPKLAYNMFSQALNKRLGVDGKNISEIAELAAKRNMSITDVMALPE